jgi:hypothetical protein
MEEAYDDCKSKKLVLLVCKVLYVCMVCKKLTLLVNYATHPSSMTAHAAGVLAHRTLYI